MSQRLVLPFKAKKILLAAGYKVPGYLKGWGFHHYGHDYGFREAGYDTYACGEGEVAACGLDGDAPYGSGAKLGNCIVIVYQDVVCPDGKTRNLACQMCHFESIAVKAGQKVTSDTLIGRYGNTGGRDYTAHLHIQFDTDTDYPRYMYGIASTGKVMVKGTVDSTINPCKVWYLREGQGITATNGETYYFPEELQVQPLPEEGGDREDYREKYLETLAKLNQEKARYQILANEIRKLAEKA